MARLKKKLTKNVQKRTKNTILVNFFEQLLIVILL